MFEKLDESTSISRVGFVFLVYVLVSAGYISEVLSCQMRKLFVTSSYFRHIFAIIMVFVFIMFEGGWDFDKKEEEKADTNWATGNTIHSIIIAILIYIIFILSSKSKIIPNLIFFGLLFVLYFINTHRAYALERNQISAETNDKIMFIERIIVVVCMIVLIYGFVEYYFYQLAEHPNDFSWKLFLLGVSKCKSIQN
jgi:hypothetical protein